MPRSTAALIGHGLLTEWATAMERLSQGGIGWPTASVEGRAIRSTGHGIPGPMVPHDAGWSTAETLTHLAVRSAPSEIWHLIDEVYRRQGAGSERALREARVWVAAFVSAKMSH